MSLGLLVPILYQLGSDKVMEGFGRSLDGIPLPTNSILNPNHVYESHDPPPLSLPFPN
jgi:hypothetical protein